jgi:DNA-binding NarL/FixJ family response regulator
MGHDASPLVLRVDASVPALVRARLLAHGDGDAVRVDDASRTTHDTSERDAAVTVRAWDDGARVASGPTVWLVSSPSPIAALPLASASHAAWLPLDADPAAVLAAAQAVRGGLVAIAPGALRERRVGTRTRAGTMPTPSDRITGEAAEGMPLTERELEVLRALAEGLGNKQVGARLGIGTSTVKSHLEAIYAKLGARTRSEAVSRGLRAGLVPL